MINWIHLYLLLKLTTLQYTFIIAGASITIALASLLLNYQAFQLEIKKKWFFISLSLSVSMTIFGVMLPDTQQAAVIYIVPKVVNSDFVQTELSKDADEMYSLAKDWLREQIMISKKQSKLSTDKKLRQIEQILNNERVTYND